MRRFYTAKPQKRLDLVVERQYASQETVNRLREGLTLETADQMIENAFGVYGLPYGLAFNFLINGKDYQIPMATEEPSVIAAASGAAKTIKAAGGFQAKVQTRAMIGQVALIEVERLEVAKKAIEDSQGEILHIANEAYPSIVKRGGGAQQVQVEILSNNTSDQTFLVVYITIDTQEAMGANIVNTMMEAVAERLEEISGGQALMSILSNYADSSLVTSTCQIPLEQLTYKKIEGKELAQKIEAASQLAQVDVYRATTHNKGIMNGVDALVIATGNDWRAIEAGAHAYASRDGQYQGLSKWWVEDDRLHGDLTLPMAIGSVGGSIKIHPYARATFEILKIDGGETGAAKELAAVIASLGLAQNFAALRALVSEGIQKGHMALQAKSLALAVGAQTEEIPLLVRKLKQEGKMNQATAQALLDEMRQ